MNEFVELNHDQADALMAAWYCEQSRIRHEAEKWVGQTERDVTKRDRYIQSALDLGVPLGQIQRFVY